MNDPFFSLALVALADSALLAYACMRYQRYARNRRIMRSLRGALRSGALQSAGGVQGLAFQQAA
jgi:hypothetical protein